MHGLKYRELQNRLKKASVLIEGKTLSVEQLDLTQAQRTPSMLPLADARDNFIRDYIDAALERNGGNRSRTARELGVDPRTIFRHLERWRA